MMSDASSARAQLQEVTFERLESGGCVVRVKMGRRLSSVLQQTYLGRAEGECSPSSEMVLAAKATIEALERTYGAPAGAFRFGDIKTVESFEKLAVIVAVHVEHESGPLRLVGFCEVDVKLTTAVAKAVCNALNRFLTLAYS
jgi:hypothetical protein